MNEKRDIAGQFESVPERVALSGEGLADMSLPQFRTLVRTLTSMHIDVEPVGPSGERDEDMGEDTPIYFKHFAKHAEKEGIETPLPVRAWNAIWRGRYYNPGDHHPSRYPYGNRIRSLPEDIFIDEGIEVSALSLQGLARASEKKILLDIPNFGAGAEEFINGLIKSMQTEEES
jgi:hypothetical protein